MEKPFQVRAIRNLTDSAYVVRFDRHGVAFQAGQHILLGPVNGVETREYSVYSGEEDAYFEVLVREVEDGNVSRKLKRLQVGDELQFNIPVGYFTPRQADVDTRRFVFVATGTGIAPFHSFVRTYPEMDYTLLHGVRYAEECYERNHYAPARYKACTSRDSQGDYQGRVTQYLREQPVDTDALYFLCGNVRMIDEAYDILQNRGVPASNLRAEVYF